jgi:hypothetical protein
MVAGAKPALQPVGGNNLKPQPPHDLKPPNFIQKIVHKLSEIFAHNERLGGPTR